ncbi:MAG: hypothetical protein FJW53_03660, partial [Actinobacteria bacterium]|nr:hypothetical protein [Actinomycetota bacterium]
QAIARDAGLPVVRLHATRHTSATLLFDAGVPVHVVSRRLGHTSVATTADVYVARMPSADRAAADTWATILARSGEGRRKDAGRTPEGPNDPNIGGLPEHGTLVGQGIGTTRNPPMEATPRIELG